MSAPPYLSVSRLVQYKSALATSAESAALGWWWILGWQITSLGAISMKQIKFRGMEDDMRGDVNGGHIRGPDQKIEMLLRRTSSRLPTMQRKIARVDAPMKTASDLKRRMNSRTCIRHSIMLNL